MRYIARPEIGTIVKLPSFTRVKLRYAAGSGVDKEGAMARQNEHSQKVREKRSMSTLTGAKHGVLALTMSRVPEAQPRPNSGVS